jgi:hypothetical protein
MSRWRDASFWSKRRGTYAGDCRQSDLGSSVTAALIRENLYIARGADSVSGNTMIMRG